MMNMQSKVARDDLLSMIERITPETAGSTAPPTVAPPPPAPALLEAEADREPFGTWLLRQTKRDGWVGDLAKGAKADRTFPKNGSPDDVRKHIHKQGADGDMFEAVDDAETDWLSS